MTEITLNWTASSGGNLQGYNIYRSSDGIIFTKINTTPVNDVMYTDSTPGEGIRFYKVSAVRDVESGYSNVTRNARGTRISGTKTGSYTAAIANSPYVIESNVTINGGDFTIPTGSAVYVLDGVTIDIENKYSIIVNGTFQIWAAPTATGHTTLTAHKPGGIPVDSAYGEGFLLKLYGASYNPADSSGTLFINVDIKNIHTGQNQLDIINCAPKYDNCKISSIANCPFSMGTGAIFSHCVLNNLEPNIESDLKSTPFKIEYCVINPGNLNYCFNFVTFPNPIKPGQIAQNDINTTSKIGFWNYKGGDIPMGNNYWHNGTVIEIPAFEYSGGSGGVGCNFIPILKSAPANVGPVGW